VIAPGITAYHPRTEWEQVGFRMGLDFTRLPTLINMRTVRQMVAHYTGAKETPTGDPGEDMTDVRDYLRAIERDYMINRTGGGYIRKSDGRYFPGYHTGYSFCVDWTGGVWEIRGFDFLPAATNMHNGYTIAVLFFTDGADPATPEQWTAARAIGRLARDASQRTDFNPKFTDHGLLTLATGTGTVTACAGAGVRGQLTTQGNIDQDAPPPPPPPFTPGPPAPAPTDKDDNMVVALDKNGTAWIGDGIHRFEPTEAQFNNYVVLGKAGCYRFVNTSGQVVSGWGNVATVGDDTIAADHAAIFVSAVGAAIAGVIAAATSLIIAIRKRPQDLNGGAKEPPAPTPEGQDEGLE
jgi:hypothetical protein